MKKNISFIVIGKNEAKTLVKSIQSIFNVQKELLQDYESEIIYVDSGSEDDSADLASSSGYVDKVYVLDGEVNAAIARNVGADNSNGSILCFLDADMFLYRQCFFEILGKIETGGEDFVSSDLIDIEYDRFGNVQRQSKRYKVAVNRYETTTGGFFVIKKSAWDLVGGMKNAFRRNQDLDLGLRLAKNGIKLLRVSCTAVRHHTIAYTSPYRFFADARKGNFLYPGVLLRRNFFNKSAHRYLLKRYLSSMLLLASIFLTIFYLNFSVLSAYFISWSVIILARSLKPARLVNDLLMRFLVDLSFFLGFLLFFPKNNYKYNLFKV